MFSMALSRQVHRLILLLMLAAVLSCTTQAERYEEQTARLREKVRQSFSPKFDPIWIAKKKNAQKAGQELVRLIAVMDDALKELAGYAPPLEMAGVHEKHRSLFTECKRALKEIQAEARQKEPNGMKAVRIYQKMSQKILEAGERN
jgi:hypothetical protein